MAHAHVMQWLIQIDVSFPKNLSQQVHNILCRPYLCCRWQLCAQYYREMLTSGSVDYVAFLSTFGCKSVLKACALCMCWLYPKVANGGQAENKMNLPVPVYLRPLDQKDASMKVRKSTTG